MPKILERCVQHVKDTGKSEDAAWPICIDKLRKKHPTVEKWLHRKRKKKKGLSQRDVIKLSSRDGWIGVDLDGTLAYHDSQGFDIQHIGDPIEPMLKRVKKWLADGQTVKIFTARAHDPAAIAPVKKWLKENGLPDLEVTNIKDPKMIELWDDRAVSVQKNIGEINNNIVGSEKPEEK